MNLPAIPITTLVSTARPIERSSSGGTLVVVAEGEFNVAGNKEVDMDEENVADVGENASSVEHFEPG